MAVHAMHMNALNSLAATVKGPVAQRIRHLTTDQGIPGSNPGRVDFFLLLCGPIAHLYALSLNLFECCNLSLCEQLCYHITKN